MIKRILSIVLFLSIFACDSENASDCFQTAGDVVQQEIAVPVFDKILVNDLIELIIKEGPSQKVVVETGENLVNDVNATVTDGRLELTNNNVCNFVREFGITKVIVTSPNITEIRSGTRFDVRSEGVLTYPQIELLSETFNAPETAAVGNFYMNIQNDRVRVVFNNLSNLFIQGTTENFNISFAAGNPRLEGANFIAQNITVFHRGSNDMIVHPVASIQGRIVSTGNVIAVNRPAIVEVEELLDGRLIFTN